MAKYTITITPEEETLAAVRAAMRGYDWRLEAVLTFGGPSSVAVQVYTKAEGSKRYAKVGPLIFPPDGGTLADTLAILGGLAAAEETAADVSNRAAVAAAVTELTA